MEGNIRDYATLEQLVVLSNMESINAVMLHQEPSSVNRILYRYIRINAVMLHQELVQSERIIQLNKIAISQLKSLAENKQLNKLK